MGWTNWKDMTPAQCVEAVKSRPEWHMSEFSRFDFLICKNGHVSKRKGGGSHELSDQSCNILYKEIIGEDVCSKGDNHEWKPGVTFHFSHK
jgi:hypothetical protein